MRLSRLSPSRAMTLTRPTKTPKGPTGESVGQVATGSRGGWLFVGYYSGRSIHAGKVCRGRTSPMGGFFRPSMLAPSIIIPSVHFKTCIIIPSQPSRREKLGRMSLPRSFQYYVRQMEVSEHIAVSSITCIIVKALNLNPLPWTGIAQWIWESRGVGC